MLVAVHQIQLVWEFVNSRLPGREGKTKSVVPYFCHFLFHGCLPQGRYLFSGGVHIRLRAHGYWFVVVPLLWCQLLTRVCKGTQEKHEVIFVVSKESLNYWQRGQGNDTNIHMTCYPNGAFFRGWRASFCFWEGQGLRNSLVQSLLLFTFAFSR